MFVCPVSWKWSRKTVNEFLMRDERKAGFKISICGLHVALATKVWILCSVVIDLMLMKICAEWLMWSTWSFLWLPPTIILLVSSGVAFRMKSPALMLPTIFYSEFAYVRACAILLYWLWTVIRFSDRSIDLKEAIARALDSRYFAETGDGVLWSLVTAITLVLIVYLRIMNANVNMTIKCQNYFAAMKRDQAKSVDEEGANEEASE